MVSVYVCTMASTLIDIEYQDEVDEFAIDNSKVDLLKLNAEFIYFLFNTSIDYGMVQNFCYFFQFIFISFQRSNLKGSLVKPSQKSKTKDMQQWITLHGIKADRIKAKVI